MFAPRQPTQVIVLGFAAATAVALAYPLGYLRDLRNAILSRVHRTKAWQGSAVATSVGACSSMSADSFHIQGISDLSMKAAGTLGGVVAGPVLASVGYSEVGFLGGMALVAVVVIWIALHAGRASAPQPVHS